jgi:quercetin dioxygenase-like cupin family protein
VVPLLQPTTACAHFCFFSLLHISLLADAHQDQIHDLYTDTSHIHTELKVNGFPCKANATADDFFSSVIAKPGNITSPAGSVVTGANVEKIPGLNTLGVSLARIDYAPGGLNPPHTHPRATELIFVLYGTLDVGFVTTANKLVAKTVAAGDVFAFPRGLVHFQSNPGKEPAAVVSAFNSQLAGTQSIAMTLFGASPEVSSDVLAKAFQIGSEEVDDIKAKFAPKKT